MNNLKIKEFRLSELVDVQLDGINMADYPDFIDAYVTSASHPDGTELNDDELDYLNDHYSDDIYKLVLSTVF